MMFGNETVIVSPGTTYDSNDDPVAGVGSPDEIEGCVVEPLGSEELTVRGRTGTYSKIRIFLPVTEGVAATDVVSARGKSYEILGEPDEWIDEDPDLTGLVVTAVRMRG
jgi:hypothetical protein